MLSNFADVVQRQATKELETNGFHKPIKFVWDLLLVQMSHRNASTFKPIPILKTIGSNATTLCMFSGTWQGIKPQETAS